MIISLNSAGSTFLRTVDSRLMSYNIEMTEVTGGTFWKSYTPGQIAGTEDFPSPSGLGANFTAMMDLMQYYPPIDLYNEKLRKLAAHLGPVWVRVSGSWATKTYYDLDDATGGQVPEGYQSILTREQWIGVLDFVKAVNGKLLISVSNCAGDHPHGGPLDLTQTRKLFDFSHAYGVDIAAAEFMNEPNMLEMSGAPAGYTPADFVRDQDIFNGWVREHYPRCLLAGPCTVAVSMGNETAPSGGIENLMNTCSAQQLLDGAQIPMDVYSYHYYNGVSERLAGMMPAGHWPADQAHTDNYLAVAPNTARQQTALRDQYIPGGPIWVTESGDAGGGGDTWASTFLDVFRTLNELGSFSTITDGVIFHNTLASSDYGFLKHGSFEPRPNYFAVLLWNRLMGTGVYDASQLCRENLHVYCHSRRDGKPGRVWLIVHNDPNHSTSVELSNKASVYTLTGSDGLRSAIMDLNGHPLTLTENDDLPELSGMPVEASVLTLPPASCTFLVTE